MSLLEWAASIVMLSLRGGERRIDFESVAQVFAVDLRAVAKLLKAGAPAAEVAAALLSPRGRASMPSWWRRLAARRSMKCLFDSRRPAASGGRGCRASR